MKFTFSKPIALAVWINQHHFSSLREEQLMAEGINSHKATGIYAIVVNENELLRA